MFRKRFVRLALGAPVGELGVETRDLRAQRGQLPLVGPCGRHRGSPARSRCLRSVSSQRARWPRPRRRRAVPRPHPTRREPAARPRWLARTNPLPGGARAGFHGCRPWRPPSAPSPAQFRGRQRVEQVRREAVAQYQLAGGLRPARSDVAHRSTTNGRLAASGQRAAQRARASIRNRPWRASRATSRSRARRHRQRSA